GLFRPDIPVNRAEFLKVLTLAAFGSAAESEDVTCFTDFAGTVQWYRSYACSAKEHGLVDGYPDGTFRGDQPINLAEAAKMAVTAWGMQTPVYFREPDHWYDPFLDAVAFTGVRDALGGPDHLLTRSDMAWFLVALRQPLATVEPPVSSASSSSLSSSFSSVSSASSISFPVCGNSVLDSGEECDDGNAEDGDGCSSICVVVPEPVQHSALRIDQKSQGSVSVAGGTRNIALLTFDATTRWQDALLNGLTFRVTVGSLQSAINYQLFADVGENGISEQVGMGVVRGDSLTFSGLNVVVAQNRATHFEVRADIQAQTSAVTMQIAFDTSDAQYVEAVGADDGRQLVGIRTDGVSCGLNNCWIAVYTTDSPTFTFAERGNLFVTAGSVPVRSRQILLGGGSDDLLRLSFRATDEDIQIRRLQIGGATNSISHLELLEPGAAQPFTTATSAQCRTVQSGVFCAVFTFTVRKDLTRDIVVRAVAKPDTEGGESGETVTPALTASVTDADHAVEARGLSSEEDLTQNDGDGTAEGEIFIGRDSAGPNMAVVGPTHDLVGARLASITNVSSDADGTFVPSGLSDLGEFRFRAASNFNSRNGLNRVELTDLTFALSSSNVLFEAGSFVLVNALVPTLTAACTESAITGSISVTCSGLDTSGVQVAIDQGHYADLLLKARIASAQITGGSSVLQTSLNGLGARGGISSVLWHDDVFPQTWVDVPEATVTSTQYRTP
ncbi:MAG: S-layer homology domain-containing protein, partial [Candidatus Peribacteraceae bacterium]|nr:S-layer homology domain-containing protein [Candidatus Peribacteraceae bacterium]